MPIHRAQRHPHKLRNFLKIRPVPNPQHHHLTLHRRQLRQRRLNLRAIQPTTRIRTILKTHRLAQAPHSAPRAAAPLFAASIAAFRTVTKQPPAQIPRNLILHRQPHKSLLHQILSKSGIRPLPRVKPQPRRIGVKAPTELLRRDAHPTFAVCHTLKDDMEMILFGRIKSLAGELAASLPREASTSTGSRVQGFKGSNSRHPHLALSPYPLPITPSPATTATTATPSPPPQRPRPDKRAG